MTRIFTTLLASRECLLRCVSCASGLLTDVPANRDMFSLSQHHLGHVALFCDLNVSKCLETALENSFVVVFKSMKCL